MSPAVAARGTPPRTSTPPASPSSATHPPTPRPTSPGQRSPRKPVVPGPIPPLKINRRPKSPASQSPSPPRQPPLTFWSVAPPPQSCHTLTSKREALTRYVFPAVPESFSVDLSGPDVNLAIDQLRMRSRGDEFRNGGSPTHVRLQYHSGIRTLLLNSLNRICQPPNADAPLSADEQRYADLYNLTLRQWSDKCKAAHASALSRSTDEIEASRLGFTHLAEPMNEFLSNKRTFVHGRRPLYTTGWACPSVHNKSGNTDWVAFSSDTPLAVLKWKQGITDAEMTGIAQAAIGPVTSWPLDVYPGFGICLEDEKIRCDAKLDCNSVLACLLAWSDSHHYSTRWSVIFNGRTALVFFLAKPDQLFVSELVYHDAGVQNDDLTIAVIMFALCVLGANDRPTVTMSDDVLRFYPPPTRTRTKKLRRVPSTVNKSKMDVDDNSSTGTPEKHTVRN